MNIFDVFLLGFFLICFYVYKIVQRSVKEIELEDEKTSCLTELEIQKEKKVRKQWLYALFLYWLCGMCVIIVLSVIDAAITARDLLWLPFLGILTILTIMVFLFPYHCAYRKRGTGLLLWIIIILPLKELEEVSKTQWNQLNPIATYLYLLILGIDIFYWVSCCRLRKANSIRRDKIERSGKEKCIENTVIGSS